MSVTVTAVNDELVNVQVTDENINISLDSDSINVAVGDAYLPLDDYQKKIYIGTTPPPVAALNDLWLDIS